jgi:hypothetical protein
MIRKVTIAYFLALTLGSLTVASWAQQPQSGKVVFLRGNELLSAKADGSEVKLLVKDGLRKADPRWSPDKEKILYRTDGDKSKDPKTHANLIIIAADGSPLKTLQALATEADGMVVGGMRFVEASGWHSDSAVFAAGSINPSNAEYRIIDIQTEEVVESYFGTGFATCASKGQVAYATRNGRVSEPPKNNIEINGAVIYSSSSSRNSYIERLQWSDDCERLAFTEGNEANANFVVLHGGEVEAKIPLRADLLQSLSITNTRNLTEERMRPGADSSERSKQIRRASETSFLLRTASGPLVYDAAARSLSPAPEAVKREEQKIVEREKVLKSLGGRSANWQR